MSAKKKLWSRKQLAQWITDERGDEVSVDVLRKNEDGWGLSEARGVDANARTVRYDSEKAKKALKAKGIV